MRVAKVVCGSNAGNWRAMFVKAQRKKGFEVEDDSFADQFFHFGSCVCEYKANL